MIALSPKNIGLSQNKQRKIFILYRFLTLFMIYILNILAEIIFLWK